MGSTCAAPANDAGPAADFPAPAEGGARDREHLAVLDGWRGISILLVLATHLLPLGPKAWQFNLSTGLMGMAVFFVLSGFLITSFLIDNPSILEFLARRFFRIIPLAWLYLALALAIHGATRESWWAHFLFFANFPPKQLGPLTDHMWSVCIEVQFYAAIAMLVALAGRRGLLILPVLCLLVTAARVADGAYASTVTYLRLDEILAGCVLALVYHDRFGSRLRTAVAALPKWPLLILLAVSCMKQGEWLNYFRPYLAAMLVGSTLLGAPTMLTRALHSRVLAYIAGISYALYVIHPLLAASWLGSGDVIEKYLKRPLLFVALFLLAHLSTYRFERKWIALGRRIKGRDKPDAVVATDVERKPQ